MTFPERLSVIEIASLTVGWLLCFIHDFGKFARRGGRGVWMGTVLYLGIHSAVLYCMWMAMPLPPMAIFPILIVEHLAGMIIMARCVGEEII